MELTAKGLAIIAIPAFITAVGNITDNSLRWRAEMEQKEFDRQTRILDRIMSVPVAEQRLAIANFYLSTGAFTGKYKDELEASIQLATDELSSIPEPDFSYNNKIVLPDVAYDRVIDYEGIELPFDVPTMDIPKPASSILDEVTIPFSAEQVQKKIPETIFSFDQ